MICLPPSTSLLPTSSFLSPTHLHPPRRCVRRPRKFTICFSHVNNSSHSSIICCLFIDSAQYHRSACTPGDFIPFGGLSFILARYSQGFSQKTRGGTYVPSR